MLPRAVVAMVLGCLVVGMAAVEGQSKLMLNIVGATSIGVALLVTFLPMPQ